MRVKKPLDYIREVEDEKLAGELEQLYRRWRRTLDVSDFVAFLNLISERKEKLGLPQRFGKFRAYSLEEYVYRLLKEKLGFENVYWGLPVEVRKGYGIEADVSVGSLVEGVVRADLVIDCKVELDASRLKVALANAVLVKEANPRLAFFVVYAEKEVEQILVELSKAWIDGVYSIFELEKLLNDVKKVLKSSKDLSPCSS